MYKSSKTNGTIQNEESASKQCLRSEMRVNRDKKISIIDWLDESHSLLLIQTV